jgi:predicted Zn-dependent peptidase
VTDQELQKAKNQLRAGLVRRLMTTEDKGNEIGVFETKYGDYRTLFTILDKYDAVTNDDVKRVANEYFKKRHRTVVTLVIPKDAKEGDDDKN